MRKLVHYAILEDMQKYIPGLNPNVYDENGSETAPSVIEYAKNYYAKHLPVDVTAWIRVNKPDDDLIYKDELGKQVCFVRDTLCGLLFSDSAEEYENNPPMVISTHHSKSVLLPVYQINLKKYGIEIVLRDNFYDWKVSISSKQPIECDFMGLFDVNQRISAVYCEGFPETKVYGSYSENHSNFTFEVPTHYEVYTFLFLLKNHLETSFHEDTTETIYGMPIVPYRDKNDVNFGCFEGIVIANCISNFGGVEIMKMINKDNGYFTDSWMSISFDEIREYETSGKAKAEFLVSKARELGDGTEEIAICENLVPNLHLLDETWEKLQKLKKEK